MQAIYKLYVCFIFSFYWFTFVVFSVGTVSCNTSQVGLLEDGLSLDNGTRLIITLFFVIFEIHIQFKKGFDIKMCAYFCAIAVRVV